MTVDWAGIANDWHNQQPHPANPLLSVGEYPTAARLATQAKFGGHASAAEAGAFWTEFKSMNASLMAQQKQPVSPEEFGHLMDRVAPVSFAYHGRPPTMSELALMRDKTPADVRRHYGDLPDQVYPHVTAHDMAKYMTLAEPYARTHAQRQPNKLEASRFALGGFSPDQMDAYYKAGARQGQPPSQQSAGGDQGPAQQAAQGKQAQ